MSVSNNKGQGNMEKNSPSQIRKINLWKSTLVLITLGDGSERERGSVYTSMSDPTVYLAKQVRMREIYFDSSSVKRGRGGIPQPSHLSQCPKPPRFKTPKRLQNKWSFVIQNKLCNRTFKKTIESLTQGLGVMFIVIWHLALWSLNL